MKKRTRKNIRALIPFAVISLVISAGFFSASPAEDSNPSKVIFHVS